MNPEIYLKNLIVSIRRRAVDSDEKADFEFDQSLLLGDASIGLDSMDLAEIVARIQKDFGVTLFEGDNVVSSWGDIISLLNGRHYLS